jgi:PKD repeat protein
VGTRLSHDRALVAFVAAGALVVAALTSLTSTAGPAVADTYPPPNLPATVSADRLPTWQIDGVVWSQIVVGNTVYATGSFTKARPPGTSSGDPQEVTRNNLLAYDITTGNLVTSFNHSLNAQGLVVAASPDGSRVYVGGDFTTVDGAAHNHLAAFSTATGALVSTFTASVSGRIRGISATNSTVYFGGNFFSLNGSTRTRLAAVTASTGANISTWRPTADDDEVWAMTLSPDMTRVIVGGRFSTLNGVAAYGMGSLDASTGETLAWAANQTLRDAGPNGAITSLRTYGNQIYGTGYAFGSGATWEGPFAAEPSTGAIVWANDCHGDTYDIFGVGELAYSVGHAHDCSPVGGFPDVNPRKWYHATATTTYATGTNTGPDTYGWNYNGVPSSTLLHWYPALAVGTYTGQSQAAWAITGNANYVALGGEFPSVNGTAQQGLVRFAVKQIAPNKVAPNWISGLTPNAISLMAGSARVTWSETWDYDQLNLRYQVLRDGGSSPVGTVDGADDFWNLRTMGLIDTGLAPGSSHTYKIRVIDPDGNLVGSNVSAPVTITDSASSTYASNVIADQAADYWRLGEMSGTTAYDYAGFVDDSLTGGPTLGVNGAIAGDPNKAMTFDGANDLAATKTRVTAPSSFSLEAWIKTTTTTGGKIIGYGSAASGNSSSYDRHVYMTNAGRIVFGTWTGTANTITSPQSYNNGQWHHIVATQGANGMGLYIDGTPVGSHAQTGAQLYSGYWRIGGDNLGGWPSKPTSNYFKGTIDDVAVYPLTLSASQVSVHYGIGKGTITPNQPPVAAFTSSCSFLACSFDASGSSDPDGTISSYSWDFGDGTTGTGNTPSHTYALAGSYAVKLTVVDNSGGIDTVTHQVSAVAANQLPLAAFTSSCSFLACSFDASGSSDPDGTISSYSWDFGDGTTGTGKTASHTYGTAGTYSVQLTVTDNTGGTGTVTHTVAPTDPPVGLASDTFTRIVTGGLGIADSGGAWTVGGTASNFSVDGSAGKVVMPVAGASRPGYLNAISTTDSDISITAAIDKISTGNGVFFSVVGRNVTGAGQYRGRIRFLQSGNIGLAVSRTDATTAETLIVGEQTIPGLTYAAGTVIHVRTQVFGTAPTTVRAKVWADGTAEPPDWQVSGTDSTASLQGAGSIGFYGYLSGTATNAPVTLTIDNLSAVNAGGGPAPQPLCGFTAAGSASKVMVIWEENRDEASVVGSPNAPYLNNTVKAQCGIATSYSGLGHPSLPNYMSATSGVSYDFAPWTNDCSPGGSCLSSEANIFKQQEDNGKSWRSYNEAMTSNCQKVNSGTYLVRHNPAAYYTDLANCNTWDIPLGTTAAGALGNDVNNGTLPTYSTVTPDSCNDGHDCSTSTMDGWLAAWVPKIIAGPDYQQGRLVIIIAWDESEGANPLIPAFVLSAHTQPGATSATAFDHYSLLRTSEEITDVPLLGNASTARSMRSAFNL